MARLRRLAGTSVGSKAIVASTGVLLFLFLIVHLLGNLQIYAGPKAFNEYAWFYKDHPKLLWTARIGLLAIFLIHVVFTVKLKIENWRARPERYCFDATVTATVASRTMFWTGLLVFAFVVYHLLHFTAHVVDTGAMGTDPETGRLDAYAMVIAGFSLPWVVISYVVAQILLGFHLYHAVQSFFQTMGWKHATVNRLILYGCPALGVLIAAGNCLIPISILAGWVS